MTRKLKALCLALVAAFAVNAMVASGASAEDLFTSDSTKGKTQITGEQELGSKHKFTVIGQPIECEKAVFHGTTVANSVNQVTITPTYENCTYNGSAAQVTLNSCKYNITAQTNATNHNVVHIVECPTSAPILVHIIVGGATCTLTIINQTTGEGVKITNETSGANKALTVLATAKVEIHAAAGVLACKALAGTKPAYTGATTLTGTDEDTGKPANITFDTGTDSA